MTSEAGDPILRMLADLPPPVPRTDRTDGVRTRCHQAFAARRRKQSRRRSAATLGMDAACFAVLGVYLAGVVTEAFRLARLL